MLNANGTFGDYSNPNDTFFLISTMMTYIYRSNNEQNHCKCLVKSMDLLATSVVYQDMIVVYQDMIDVHQVTSSGLVPNCFHPWFQHVHLIH